MQLVELDDQGAVVGSTDHEVMEDSCNAEITLYAMVGSPSSNTMRVQSKIKNQEMVSLLDKGSTHNFLMPLVIKSEIAVWYLPNLEVEVANGSMIKTQGLCHGVTISMQVRKFIVDFNILYLGGCEVVLGTQ